MIEGLVFLSGMGFATFLIYGWQILYEIVRHHSMLERQTPDVPTEFCVFAVLGFLVWFVGTWLGGVL